MNDIEKLLIEKTQYGGNSNPNSKAISASEFGKDILQIYLRQKYGVIENESFSQNTIGSICHIGIQELLKDKYMFEYDLEHKMSNGWSITGSIDLLNIKDREFFDIKVTKSYTIEKVMKEPDHQYIWQLSVYKYLLEKHFGFDFNGYLLFVLKDGGFNFKSMRENPSIEIVNPHLKSNEEVEQKFYQIVDILESGIEPEQCKDLWWRKTKTGSMPMRCSKYCSYNKYCKYFKNMNPMNINF